MNRSAKWSLGLVLLALALTWFLTRSRPEPRVSDGRTPAGADLSTPVDPGHPDGPPISFRDDGQGGANVFAGGTTASPALSPAAPAPPVADRVAVPAKVPAPVTVPADFLKQILSADEKTVTIPLPGGGTVTGAVTRVDRDGETLTLVQGVVTRPEPGRFYFQKQAVQGVAGPMAGSIHYDKADTAYRVSPSGVNGAPVLEQVTVDEVICRSYMPGPDVSRMPPEEAPQSHPSNYPIPPSENGIIPLQSLPGATAVVYLDFDGEEEDFISWGYIKGLPSGTSNAAIYEVWKAVCEDFQPFNINITTQRSVYNAAPEGRRMHVIITPTKDAAPTAGGVAYLNSFNQSGHRVCWVFILSGKNCAEAISHEVGHTLRLSHDGRTSPAESYYEGHNGWAPIMGVGYYEPLSQWSKGEYPSANQKQDDLAIIVGENNDVDYRADDAGATYATAPYLDISAGGAVSNEGIIETRADEDAYRFTTAGGTVTLNINNVTFNPNLDIKAEIVTAAGTVVATSDPSGSTDASFSGLNLAAGDYILRVSGTGNGDLTTGYSDYGSLGTYLISGTVSGGVHANRFNVVENTANGSAVGTVAARVSHGAGSLQYAITSGNTGGAFSIDPATGAITVAASTLLNYEALSTRWDDPAAFELFISITDSLGTATESLRTVVTVVDVNEPPVVAPLATLVLPDGLAPGSVVTTVSATDPDRFDFPTYSITGGNTGNAFSINANTGEITQLGALNFQTTPSYALAIRVSDKLTPVNQVNLTLTVTVMGTPVGFTPGSATRVFYNGITGTSVADLMGNVNFPNNPSSTEVLSSFDGGTARGDNYGSTIRAYLLAPVTGDYRFWIASDDSSELRISPDASVANSVVRASLSGSVSPYAWTGSPSQQSGLIPLVAGQIYYIEARHKEGTGVDHLEVAWQIPGAPAKEVIPGRWLSPFKQTFPPVVPAQSGVVRELALNGQQVMQVVATDNDTGQTITSYAITAGNGAGLFAIDPTTGVITVANGAGLVVGATHALTVQVTDSDSPVLSGTGTVTIRVLHLQEQLHAWWKLDESSGNAVSDSSGSGRVATLVGGGSWIPSGRTLGGLSLNGTDAHFDYLGNDSLSGTTPFTVMAWVKIPSALSTDGMLIQQREVNGTEGQYRVYVRASGQVNFSLSGKNAAGLDDGTQFDFTTSGASIMDGAWHHVACVRDGDTGSIYIDGVNRATASGTVRQLGPALTVAVGYDARDLTSYLGGSVDDVRIYSEALGISQIRKIADAPAVAITSPALDKVQLPTGTGMILEAVAAAPDGGVPGVTWTKVSGPGTVTFGTAGAINTTANFSSVGTYVLRLTASDGGINTGFDEISVQVGGVPVINLSGYTYGSGAPGSHTVISSTSYTLTGSSAGIGGSKSSDGFYLLGQNFMGNFDVKARVVSGTDVIGSSGENAGLIVRQGVTGVANGISSYIGCDSTPEEWGYWIRRTASPGLNTLTEYAEPAMNLPTWCRLARVGNTVTAYHSDDGTNWTTRGTLTVPGEARVGLCWSSGNMSATGTAVFDNVSGFAVENIGAVVNAGADASVALGATATLDGTVTDDGRPIPTVMTTAWSNPSGPGAITFGNPASIDTTAVASVPGAHVLRLIANDGQVKTYDDLTLTVTAPPWLTWQIQKFGVVDAGNPLIAGDLADPDGDGLANLLEYALGTEPKQSNGGVIAGDMVTVAGVKYLRLSVTKNPAATDVQYSIQVTGDLPNQASWNTAQTVIEVNNATTLRARDTVIAGKRFIRLKVTRSP